MRRHRRNILSLWQDEYLEQAVLPSCVWSTTFDVTAGKLNAVVNQRSCDVALGLPFNVTQYALFINMLAQVTNLKPGKMLWVIANAHIYEKHIEGINEQIKRYEKLGDFPAPKLKLNKDIKDFFDFDTSIDLKDTQLENYQHHDPIKMKVMV